MSKLHFHSFTTGKSISSFEDSIQQLTTEKNLNSQHSFVQMQQVHEAKFQEITSKTNILKPIKSIDACYTTLPNTFLSVKTADCLPILISGTSKTAVPFIAAAHAGRKGTQKKILLKLLNTLFQTYHWTQLNIWFGPAICVDCYQIDRKTHTHFDLITQNKQQIDLCTAQNTLSSSTVTLTIANHCTLHENQTYHSYRKSGPGVPMNYSFIGML